MLPLALCAAIGSASCAGRAAAARVAHTISIRGFQYAPATLTVQAGDTVTWVNEDIVPHTATGLGKEFDSGGIEVSKSWRFVAARGVSYNYQCTFHPTMRATLVVR